MGPDLTTNKTFPSIKKYYQYLFEFSYPYASRLLLLFTKLRRFKIFSNCKPPSFLFKHLVVFKNSYIGYSKKIGPMVFEYSLPQCQKMFENKAFKLFVASFLI